MLTIATITVTGPDAHPVVSEQVTVDAAVPAGSVEEELYGWIDDQFGELVESCTRNRRGGAVHLVIEECRQYPELEGIEFDWIVE